MGDSMKKTMEQVQAEQADYKRRWPVPDMPEGLTKEESYQWLENHIQVRRGQMELDRLLILAESRKAPNRSTA